MIWEICRKELLKNFQSFRFFALFAVTILLFAVNPFLLFSEYDEKLQEYDQNIERNRADRKGPFFGAYRRPNPLVFVFEGGSEAATNSFGISLDLGIMAHGRDQYGVNITFPSFQTIDWAFILKILFSLFAVILTFDAVSGEKELGTLSLMCSNSISRASIIMGKYLGALITVAVSFEFATAEIVDAGVTSQRRFYSAVRQYYDLIEDYVLRKTGKVRKHISLPPMFPAKVEGKRIKIGTPPRIVLPDDTSDFPALPKYRLSVGEGIISGIWNIVLLVIWNVVLLLLSHLFFLRYDVRY